MHMVRGTGLKGLAGIPYQRGNIIRPLLDVSRKEIEEYLKENHQYFVTDSSNLLDVYTRNKIRLNIIPQLEKQLNPNFVDTMATSIQSFKEDADYFQTVVNDVIDDTCWIVDDMCSINREKFLKQHRSIQKRVFQKLIFDIIGVDVSAALLNNLVDGCNGVVGTQIDINQKYHVLISRNEILVKSVVADNQKPKSIRAKLNTVVSIGCKQIRITETIEHNPIQNTPTTFYLPERLWHDRWEFRTRRNGDIVKVTGNMSKKLGRLFTDKKVDEHLRDNYWLLTNGMWDVYWIPDLFGGRFDDRTGNFVKFEILYITHKNTKQRAWCFCAVYSTKIWHLLFS